MGCNPRLFHPHLCWRVRLHGPLDSPFIPQPLLDSNRSSSLTIPDQTIMDMAGHVSRDMLKHYSHIRMKAKREAVAALVAKMPKERLPSLLSGKPNRTHPTPGRQLSTA